MVYQAKSDSKGGKLPVWRTGGEPRRTEANSCFLAQFAPLPIEGKGFAGLANSANCFFPITHTEKGIGFSI